MELRMSMLSDHLYPECFSRELKDMRGAQIKVGDKLAKISSSYLKPASVDIYTVRCIKNGKIFLDEYKNPMRFPGRCLVVNKLFDG